jgi:hypothetical protein
MNTNNLKQCSDILRSVYPKPQIRKTVDPNEGLSAIDRQILFYTSLMRTKLLLAKNTRHDS